MRQESHTLDEVIEFCQQQNLPARVVGDWVWIKFSGKPKQAILDALKGFGFRWSKRRKQWAHNCNHPSQPARDYAPWDRYKTRTLEEAFPTSR